MSFYVCVTVVAVLVSCLLCFSGEVMGRMMARRPMIESHEAPANNYYTTPVPYYTSTYAAPSYYTTPYAAPSYYPEPPKYYKEQEYYTTKKAEYYQTDAPKYYSAPSYYTTPATYYTTAYSAPSYYTTPAKYSYTTDAPYYTPAYTTKSYYAEEPKYYSAPATYQRKSYYWLWNFMLVGTLRHLNCHIATVYVTDNILPCSILDISPVSCFS